MSHKPFAVFVFTKEGTDTSTRYGGFGRRLQEAGALPGHDILTVALENLIFTITEDGSADVTDSVSGLSLGDAALVYLKSWQAMPEEAAALANYLFYRGIPFADHLLFGMGVSKLATVFRLWGNGISVPATLYVRRLDRLLAVLASSASDQLGDTFIVKDILGEKGKLNFLTDRRGIAHIFEQHPQEQFICQRFVANNGDYRIGIYAGEPGFAIKRVGLMDGTHLNNTSAGGTATYIEPGNLPRNITELAKRAASTADLQIAGVDIIVDSTSRRPYVLEVNQGSQIVTGAFAAENMATFSAGLGRLLHNRYAKNRRKPAQLIGRRTVAELPDLSIVKIIAKVDTGAYLSTLHADNIRLDTREGLQELVFDIVPQTKLKTIEDKTQTIRTSRYSSHTIRSSNGQLTRRYAVKTRILLGGISFPIILMLGDRTQMKFPLLIGRKALRSRFLVNVELSEASSRAGNTDMLVRRSRKL